MTDPVAMITGANRGIGAAIALALAERGYRLALGMRDPSKLPASLAEHDPLVVQYDAAVAEDARAFVEATETEFGRIDALVNNAGIGGPLELMPEPAQDDEEMDQMDPGMTGLLSDLSRDGRPAQPFRIHCSSV